ncbi:MAG: hypothetical protein ACI4DP_06920, partial [Candidatus Ornithomonoglobus sp.]
MKFKKITAFAVTASMAAGMMFAASASAQDFYASGAEEAVNANVAAYALSSYKDNAAETFVNSDTDGSSSLLTAENVRTLQFYRSDATKWAAYVVYDLTEVSVESNQLLSAVIDYNRYNSDSSVYSGGKGQGVLVGYAAKPESGYPDVITKAPSTYSGTDLAGGNAVYTELINYYGLTAIAGSGNNSITDTTPVDITAAAGKYLVVAMRGCGNSDYIGGFAITITKTKKYGTLNDDGTYTFASGAIDCKTTVGGKNCSVGDSGKAIYDMGTGCTLTLGDNMDLSEYGSVELKMNAESIKEVTDKATLKMYINEVEAAAFELTKSGDQWNTATALTSNLNADNKSGKVTLKVEEAPGKVHIFGLTFKQSDKYVAQVGTEKYETFAEAMSAADGTTAEITVLKDCEYGGMSTKPSGSTNITINAAENADVTITRTAGNAGSAMFRADGGSRTVSLGTSGGTLRIKDESTLSGTDHRTFMVGGEGNNKIVLGENLVLTKAQDDVLLYTWAGSDSPETLEINGADIGSAYKLEYS